MPAPSDLGYQVQWATKSRRLILLTGPTLKEEIRVFKLGGKSGRRLGRGNGYFFLDLAPDEKHLLALRGQFQANPAWALCVLSLDGRRERVVADNVHTAAWSRTGRSIVFSRLMKGSRPATFGEFAKTGSPGVTRRFYEAPLRGNIRPIAAKEVDKLLGPAYLAAVSTWRRVHGTEYYDAPGRLLISPNGDKAFLPYVATGVIHGDGDVAPTEAWIETDPPSFLLVHSKGQPKPIRPKLEGFTPLGWSGDSKWLYGTAEGKLIAIHLETNRMRSMSLPPDTIALAFRSESLGRSPARRD